MLLNGLRDRITVQCDGQLKTGRDVVIAALLGAEEFGFATAPLVVEGCIMMRVCHLDTCPVGVATQNPDLRAKFTGKAEHVVNFFTFIAEEIREYMAELGYRTIDEMVGHSEILEVDPEVAAKHPYAAQLDLNPIFAQPDSPFMHQDRYCTKKQDHALEKALDNKIIADAKDLIEATAQGRGDQVEPVELAYPITNVDRSVGAMLGSAVSRAGGADGLAEGALTVHFTGSAGNSFGAFLPHGVTLALRGDSNDYVGKGLSGGRIVVRPDDEFVATAEASNRNPNNDIIAGNVIAYGATSGELFIRGVVGERFCVRNSGATAVVEGIGNHGCEYMTGGRVVVLGQVGRNFGAGMSGGIAFLADDGLAPGQGGVRDQVDTSLSDIEEPTAEDLAWLDQTIAAYREWTGSTTKVEKFIKVMPRDYRRVLTIIEACQAEGKDEAETAEAIMEAVH